MGDVKEDQFLFCGTDWDLDAFDKQYGTMLLPKTPAELVNSTPHLSPDGSLILGSKTMTTFLIDAKTGNIIHRYDSGVTLSTDQADMFFMIKLWCLMRILITVQNRELLICLLYNQSSSQGQIILCGHTKQTLQEVSGM